MSMENVIDYEDYFFTKYNPDIIDLFLEIKEISNSFCLNFFNTTYQTQNGSYHFGKFIFDKIILEDEMDEETEINTDEIEYEEI